MLSIRLGLPVAPPNHILHISILDHPSALEKDRAAGQSPGKAGVVSDEQLCLGKVPQQNN